MSSQRPLIKHCRQRNHFSFRFQICDDVLRQAVEGISDLITMPGIINVDFADVKTIMQNAGSALMGIGYATGEKGRKKGQNGHQFPLLDISIEGAGEARAFRHLPGGPD